MDKKYIDIEKAEKDLKYLKTKATADVQEVKHGEWNTAGEIYECSVCGYSFENEGYLHFFNFCPCCGAKMDK